MPSAPGNNPPDQHTGKTRLDRELEEILSKNDNVRQLPPPPRRRQPSPNRSRGPSPGFTLPPRLRRALSVPILQALALGLIAYLVRDVSPLLATLASLAAVVALFVPLVQRFRGTSGPGAPETRMWRGQVIEMRPQSRSPLDGLRDWWSSRRR